MAVVDHGRVIAEGTSRELKASVGANALHLRLAREDQRAAVRELVERVTGAGPMPGDDPLEVGARLEEPAQAVRILDALNAAGIAVDGFSMGTPSLDEVFLALTGRPAEEAPDRGDRSDRKHTEPKKG